MSEEIIDLSGEAPASVAPHHAWIWNHVDHSRREMHFEPDGSISVGAGPLEQRWRLDGTDIVISGNGLDTVRLVLHPEGYWQGAYRWFDGGTVFLRPHDPPPPTATNI